MPSARTLPSTRAFLLTHLGLTALLAGPELQMRRGGTGIIGFELAGTDAKAEAIMDAWGPRGRTAARISLVLDTPYLATYAVIFARWSEDAGERLEARGLHRLGGARRVVAVAPYAAAAMDQIENAALLGVLAGRRGRWPLVARRCAQVKFALLAVAEAYIAAGLAARVAAARA